MKLKVSDMIQATGGKLLQGPADQVITKITTDTRTLTKGDFYIALVGERFDGHDFCQQALEKSACGLLVSQPLDALTLPADTIVIEVSDTQKSLGDLAHLWRSEFAIPVVGLTGSSGKTTTKDLIATCLKSQGGLCVTQGNLNNLIGLPLTIFNMKPGDDYAVLEMGMNAFGEIKRLTEIANPTIGLITNIGAAHLEGVGTIKGVAKAKAELFENMDAQAMTLVNYDDPYIRKMKTTKNKLSYGFHKKATIRGGQPEYRDQRMKMMITDPNQKTLFDLPFMGDHYAQNFLACYAVCFQLGLAPDTIQQAILDYQTRSGRGNVVEIKDKIKITDDTYNANPNSMAMALETHLLRFPKRRKLAILGEMKELGDESVDLHHQIGEKAASSHHDVLVAVGPYGPAIAEGFKNKTKNGEIYVFNQMDDLLKEINQIINDNDAILVKGSRGAQMERVIDYLKK